jgi:hypothetical protein
MAYVYYAMCHDLKIFKINDENSLSFSFKFPILHMSLCKLLVFMVIHKRWMVKYWLIIDFTHTWWRSPKFLVRPKKGPTMLKSGSSWNLVPTPALSTRRGRKACWGSGIKLGRGTSYSLIQTCIKPTNMLVSSHSGAPLVLGQAMGNYGLTWLTTAQTRGKPPPSPI